MILEGSFDGTGGHTKTQLQAAGLFRGKVTILFRRNHVAKQVTIGALYLDALSFSRAKALDFLHHLQGLLQLHLPELQNLLVVLELADQLLEGVDVRVAAQLPKVGLIFLQEKIYVRQQGELVNNLRHDHPHEVHDLDQLHSGWLELV